MGEQLIFSITDNFQERLCTSLLRGYAGSKTETYTYLLFAAKLLNILLASISAIAILLKILLARLCLFL